MNEGSFACVHKSSECNVFPETKLLKRALIYRAVLQVQLLVLQALLAVNPKLENRHMRTESGMIAVNEVRFREENGVAAYRAYEERSIRRNKIVRMLLEPGAPEKVGRGG
jgi:hypothetical protein